MVLDLASVCDNEVNAERFDRHAAIHHRCEGERTFFVDRIPIPSNEVQDFPRFVATFRRHVEFFLLLREKNIKFQIFLQVLGFKRVKFVQKS